MARTLMNTAVIDRDGVLLGDGGTEYTANSTDGNAITNDGATVLHVRNNGAGGRTITFDIPGAVDGQVITDPVVTVPGVEAMMLGPFPKAIYDQSGAGAGQMHFQCSSVDLRLQAFKLR